MNEGRSRQYLIITSIIAILGAWGCAKKETPAGDKKTATATSTAAPEKPAEAVATAGQEQGMPTMDAATILSTVDKNGDGKITQAEYYAIWKDKSVAERNFQKLDRNGDGVLSAEELRPKLGTK